MKKGIGESDGSLFLQKRPGKKKKQSGFVQEMSTVKMTFNTFCFDDEIKHEVEYCVQGITRLLVEGSRFLNFYILRLLEQYESNSVASFETLRDATSVHQASVVPEINQGFIYTVLTALADPSNVASRNDPPPGYIQSLAMFKSMRPLDFKLFEKNNLTQMVNYAAKDYYIACKNHVVTNIYKRVVNGLYRLLDTLSKKMYAKDRYKVKKLYMDCLRDAVTVISSEKWTELWDSMSQFVRESDRQLIQAYVTDTLTSRSSLLPLTDENVAKGWWNYLPWLWKLMPESLESGKQYSILPLCSFASKYITIDTGILQQLLVRISYRTGREGPENLENFRKRALEHWGEYFDIPKVRGKWSFQEIIKTDGYGVSIIRSHMKPEGEDLPILPVSLEGKRVIGVDPGRVDLITCAWNVDGEDDKQSFSHYSNKEYQSKIGLQDALKKRRKWISEAGLTDTLNNLPSAKTSSSLAMEDHIRAVYQIFDRVLHLNGLRRVRGLRFGQYGRRQKVMHDICERITFNPDESDTRPVIVAFGAGMFSSSSKGHAPGPVKGIRKALRQKKVEIYDVNEDYTSQLCHCCHEKLEPMYSKGGENGGGIAIHGVRRCLTTNCIRKTLNRDINAALNILYIFERETCYGVRPEKFTRTFQFSKKDNHAVKDPDGKVVVTRAPVSY